MFPEWSFTYFVIQVAAGLLGAHLVAHEHRFGFIGHSAVGLVTGAFSGFCLQSIVMTTVTGTGDAIPITPLQAEIFQATTGLAAGAMAMPAVGFLCHELAGNSGD
jgi:uncharacterized membrane protein YeaQ/YmgE (transglycosylase-associated protein family)